MTNNTNITNPEISNSKKSRKITLPVILALAITLLFTSVNAKLITCYKEQISQLEY